MAKPLSATVMVQEQLAVALNRMREGERAEQILLDLIRRRGPSSETYGILGRVYKDRWSEAVKSDKPALARGMIEKAIGAYLSGFEADWRDAYPGINAVTLMELRDPPDPRRLEILPVVRYAVTRRIATSRPDYWDYATLLELEVLANDEGRAMAALGDSLAAVRETWEPETTANNLHLIISVRERRNELQPWLKDIGSALLDRANSAVPNTGT